MVAIDSPLIEPTYNDFHKVCGWSFGDLSPVVSYSSTKNNNPPKLAA